MKKLNTSKVNNIYKDSCKTFFNYISTVKFLCKAKVNEEGIKTIVMKSNDKYQLIKNISWFFAKYFIVAHEISTIRKNIFNMMHNAYAAPFNEYEFNAILNNASNWWLDYSYFKIHLLIDYCNALFGNPQLCESVCKALKCSGDDYHKKRIATISIMKDVEDKALIDYAREKNRIIKDARKKNQLHAHLSAKMSEDLSAETSANLYAENYEDNSLLEANPTEEK